MAEKILIYQNPLFGQFLLFFATILYGSVSILQNKKWVPLLLKVNVAVLWMGYLLLTYCFITSDFSLKTVVEHSSLHTPLIYKIVGVWGSPEGSFLLWISLLSFTAFFIENISVQRLFAFHMFGFLAVQWYAMPIFQTMDVVLKGMDLNPLLQDQSMVFHPPILYLGQVFTGFIFFKSLDDTFSMNQQKLFVGSGFFILTLGILLGSIWAYYELGWGGFWYWDPVEVISLWAWLLYLYAFHLLHKGQYIRFIGFFMWPIVLIGMVCIRSGLLNSVHSFAAQHDFLMAAGLVLFLSFLLFGIRGRMICKKNEIKFFEVVKSNILFFIMMLSILVVLFLTVFIPIFYTNIYFSPIFYQHTVWPMILPILLVMSLKPYAFFKQYQAYQYSLILLFICIFIFLWDVQNLNFLSVLSLSLCVFGIFCALFQFLIKSYWSFKKMGMVVGHIGWFTVIISSIFVTFKSDEKVFWVNPSINTEYYLNEREKISLMHGQQYENEQYVQDELTFCMQGHMKSFNIHATLKYFKNADVLRSEMGLVREAFSQHGLVIEKKVKDSYKVRYHYKNSIFGLWIGALFILMGIIILLYENTVRKFPRCLKRNEKSLTL